MAELVSTIIPTYNRAALLVRALDSVAAQGYRPIEVVIIDDGSTDNTVEIVTARREYLASRGIDLIFHQQQNQKAPKARNVGMKLARGSLFAFLDSDDLWLPTFLETVVRLLDQHRECGMGFSGILGIDDNDVVFAERKMYLEDVEPILREGMDFLRDNGRSIGCYANRYMTVVAPDGTPTEKSYGMSWWKSLAALERWAESHPTHVRIFGAAMKYLSTLGPAAKLRLYHEVTVARADEQFFEYLDCHPQTGMLNAVQTVNAA